MAVVDVTSSEVRISERLTAEQVELLVSAFRWVKSIKLEATRGTAIEIDIPWGKQFETVAAIKSAIDAAQK